MLNESIKSNSSNIFNYPYGSRNTFYAKLKEYPSVMWPVGNDWSYKNSNKIYGTVQFDGIMKNFNEIYSNFEKTQNYLEGVLTQLNQ
jgi:hypothetical protein